MGLVACDNVLNEAAVWADFMLGDDGGAKQKAARQINQPERHFNVFRKMVRSPNIGSAVRKRDRSLTQGIGT